MNTLNAFLFALGVLLLASAGINAPKAPNISYQIGTFLPGLLCLIFSLKLGQAKKPKPGVLDDDSADPTAAYIKEASGTVITIAGILLLIAGLIFLQRSENKQNG